MVLLLASVQPVSTAHHIETTAPQHMIAAASNPVRDRYIDDAPSVILAPYRHRPPGVVHITNIPRRFCPRHIVGNKIGELLRTAIEQIE
jgi:hypothetical protein